MTTTTAMNTTTIATFTRAAQVMPCLDPPLHLCSRRRRMCTQRALGCTCGRLHRWFWAVCCQWKLLVRQGVVSRGARQKIPPSFLDGLFGAPTGVPDTFYWHRFGHWALWWGMLTARQRWTEPISRKGSSISATACFGCNQIHFASDSNIYNKQTGHV